MIQQLKNILLTTTSFLNSGKIPPNTPIEETEKLKAINHLTSSKFYIVFTSVFILAFFYFSTIACFLFIPQTPEFISGFVTLFSKTIEILAIIIASYVGAQAAVDLKYGSSSNAAIQGVMENINNVTVINTNAKEEDYELK